MQDPKTILTFLGIPWEKVSRYDINDDGEIINLYIWLIDLRPRCKYCGSSNVKIKDYYDTTIKVSVVKQKKIFLIIHQRRYICKTCKKSFKQDLGVTAKSGDTISGATKSSIIQALSTYDTITEIAEDYDVSTSTVQNLFDKFVPEQERGELPAALCIDEFKFVDRRKLGKFPAVMSDFFTGEIIDIIESRRYEYLSDYFNKFSVKERSKVKYFISDMNDTYRRIRNNFFYNASHIIDKFHVAKLFTGAVQTIRTSIMKSCEYESQEYRFLKKNWKLFLMHHTDLKQINHVSKKTGVVYTAFDDVSAVLKKYPDLNKAYWAKEDFYFKTKKPMKYIEAEKLIDYFICTFKASDCEALHSIAKTFSKWRYQLIDTFSQNSYGIQLSNAVAEGNNNKIQTFIDSSYGLTNFNRMRRRILYVQRCKKKKKK